MMSSFIDLEDEELINADENELYEENGINADSEDNADNPDVQNATSASDPAATRVAPKKKVVRNPQPKLDAERLKGPRGLMILESWFSDMKFKGKGHEKEDLDALMCRLELWTHRLFPKFTFDDCLNRIEKLGHKKPVMNYVKRIRLDMEDGVNVPEQNENSNDVINDSEVDPFDQLIGGFQEKTAQSNVVQNQPQTLTEEQRERMIRNRLLAEERRLARAKSRAEELAKMQQESEMREADTEVETEPQNTANTQPTVNNND